MPTPPFHMNAKRLFAWILLLLLLSGIGIAHAETAGEPAPTQPSLNDIKASIESREVTHQQLLDSFRALTDHRVQAETCLAENTQTIQATQDKLTNLGPTTPGESRDVSRSRQELNKTLKNLEKQRAECELRLQRSRDLLDVVTQRQEEYLAEHLLGRGATVHALLAEYGEHPARWLADSRNFLMEHTGLQNLSGTRIAVLVALLVAGFVLGLRLRAGLRRLAGRMQVHEHYSSRFLHGALAVIAQHAPLFSGTLAAAIFLHVELGELRPVPLLSLVFYGLPIYTLLIAVLQLFIAPKPPAQPLFDIPRTVAVALVRRLRVLLLLCFAGYLLYVMLQAQALPLPALQLARAVFIVALVLNLLWALWLLDQIPQLAAHAWLRRLLALLLVGSVIAEWLGYRSLSLYVLRGVLGSLLLLGVYDVLRRLLNELFAGLRSGRHGWQRSLRHLLSVHDDAALPGFGWLRATLSFTLFILLGYGLLRLWGLSGVGMAQAESYLMSGFSIGSLHIVPTRILLALLALAILLSAGAWLRGRMEHHWLRDTHMDRGAREALVTITGYVTVALAVVIALAITGMDFSNLAIVAGALSVGIGFGLQNIVNNFISGLILLFERPIKTGDWVVVGNTEGYVRRISIRSTQIQTFDQSDVIVPNSEIIQGQVTNWMLRDVHGRVRVPVSVAYGSDTAKVKELLLGIARCHPDVIADGSVAEPTVLFLAFGESALDFELRCIIENIDKRITVRSDLNFAIDAAFRAHGIEIPFPQRDLHIKSWPGAPDTAE